MKGNNMGLSRELFLTKALEMAEPGRPFWYTSGTFGPIYINTHYLYGSAEEAGKLLEQIELELKEMPSFYDRIHSEIKAQLKKSDIYKKAINLAVEKIGATFDLSAVDVISGGERRDFFFSIPLADIFEKPHLSLCKDGSAYLHSYSEASDWGGTLLEKEKFSCIYQPDLRAKRVLHIADIIVLASSWIEKWLPAVEKCGGKAEYGFAIIDRCQGGLQILAAAGVQAEVQERTNNEFFFAAVEAGLLTSVQAAQASVFLQNPQAYEEEFLRYHPNFLEEEISGGGKNKERALIYLKKHEQESAQ
ncbi:MAG: hypothetical protein PHR78_07345 [Eubacteriales bacterium]|nr:hypothetical protein [Eubacteriales bacterium]MDD4541955.1 hypothetical protein [Eubacteriales bacterium]